MSSPRVSTFQPGMVGLEHREVGLAAGAREGRGDELDDALGAGELEDQHVLGEPALVAGHHAGDAQGVALLAEQRVAAVAGAEGPDRALLGELHDVLGVAARPRDVVLAGLEGHADRVQGRHELGVELVHLLQHGGADAGHHAHAGGDVGGVGDLDAEHRVLGLEVAHHEGDDVHRAALHAPLVEVAHEDLHLLGVHPVVGGPAVLLVDRADVGAVLHAGDVDRVGRGVEGVGLDRGVEPRERAARDEGLGELGPLLVGAGDPVDAVGLGHLGDLVDEVEDALVTGGVGGGLRVGGHAGIPSRAFAKVPRPTRVASTGSTAPPAAERIGGVVVELSWIARLRCRRLLRRRGQT